MITPQQRQLLQCLGFSPDQGFSSDLLDFFLTEKETPHEEEQQEEPSQWTAGISDLPSNTTLPPWSLYTATPLTAASLPSCVSRPVLRKALDWDPSVPLSAWQRTGLTEEERLEMHVLPAPPVHLPGWTPSSLWQHFEENHEVQKKVA